MPVVLGLVPAHVDLHMGLADVLNLVLVAVHQKAIQARIACCLFGLGRACGHNKKTIDFREGLQDTPGS